MIGMVMATHPVNCISCGKPYDALQSAECNCLQKVRSFRCPHCASCFCKNQRMLDEFWRTAPPELWQRRREAVESATSANLNEDPLVRPLVLFADDDPSGRAIAAKVIHSMNFGVVTAVNGEEALALARRHTPELMITDAFMPRIDGREVSRIIRQELPNTKIVLITSVYKDARYRAEAFKEFGVDEYLTKPINPAQLRQLLEKYLSG
jgi:CheY-like chemotaxis protein